MDTADLDAVSMLALQKDPGLAAATAAVTVAVADVVVTELVSLLACPGARLETGSMDASVDDADVASSSSRLTWLRIRG